MLLYQCQFCDKPYASSSSLKRHAAVSHPNQDITTPLNVRLPAANQRPSLAVNTPTVTALTDPTSAQYGMVTRSSFFVQADPPVADPDTVEGVNPEPTPPPLNHAPDSEITSQPQVTVTSDTTVVDSSPTTVNTSTSNTSAEFNLSQYLILRRSNLQTSPRPSTSTSTGSPFRPWTPTQGTPQLHTPVLPGELYMDLAPTYMSTPNVPSRWDSPTEDMDLPTTGLSSPPHTDPTPTNIPPPDLVTYESTEPSSDGSPTHPVAQLDNVTILTNNPPTTSNHPFLPSSPYMNYAPISEVENSHVQQRIEALSTIAEEILPGRGAMIGEFVLFQYLLHRPRQSLTE